jgi:hypothetical protein
VSVMSATKTAVATAGPQSPVSGRGRSHDSTVCSPRWSLTPPRSWSQVTASVPTPPARCWSPLQTTPPEVDNEAAFAHLCGVAPTEASSSNLTRHRLNRGGDRQGQPRAVANRDHPHVRRPPNPCLRCPRALPAPGGQHSNLTSPEASLCVLSMLQITV